MRRGPPSSTLSPASQGLTVRRGGCTATVTVWLLPAARFPLRFWVCPVPASSLPGFFPPLRSKWLLQFRPSPGVCVPLWTRASGTFGVLPTVQRPQSLRREPCKVPKPFLSLPWPCSLVREGDSFTSQMLGAFVLNFEGQSRCIFSHPAPHACLLVSRGTSATEPSPGGEPHRT